MTEEPVVVKLCDMRAISYCVPGSRVFARLHGLDFMDFARNGIASDRLPAGDAMSDAVIAEARARVRRERNSV